MSRLTAPSLAIIACGAMVVAAGQPDAGKSSGSPRMLPGVEADGSMRLHNTWTIKPAGSQLELGDFPVNIAIHPSSNWLAVLHCGYGQPEIVIVEIKSAKQQL